MKAIITAAGISPELLPATKAVPKEMFPVGKKPALQHVVEEAVESGIEDIIIVTGPGRRVIEDHFDCDWGLDKVLASMELGMEFDSIKRIADQATIHYVRQREPRGLGDAILCARHHIGDEPFALLMGDDLILSTQEPVLSQLFNIHRGTGKTVVGVEEVSKKSTAAYSIVSAGEPLEFSLPSFLIHGAVDRPVPKQAPSCLALTGRYILTPPIFRFLALEASSVDGEVKLIPALDKLLRKEGGIAVQTAGKRYDIGNPKEWMDANKAVLQR